MKTKSNRPGAKLLLTLCTSVCLTALANSASAAILYWDPNGLSAPTSGTWDTTTPQWSTSSTPTDTPIVWDPTAAAGFAAGTGISKLTINVDQPITISGIFNGLVPANGVTNLIFSGNGSLNLNTGTNAEWTGSSPFGTIIRIPITGPGMFQHQGSGSVFLSATNTYSGGFSFGTSSGVNINDGNVFGTGPILIDSASMILAVVSNDSSGTAFAKGPITITNEVQTYNGDGTQILVGLAPVSGNSPVTFTGPIILRGAAGTTTTLDTRNTNWTFTGKISGAANLSKKNTATLVLSGDNTYSGNTVIQNGTVQVTSINSVNNGSPSSSLGTPADAASGVIGLGTTTTAGVLLYTGAGETSDRVISLMGTTGGGTIQNDGTSGGLILTSDLAVPGVGAKLFTLQGSNSLNVFSGKIIDNSAANPTSLTKAGTGKWTLSGANTYSGATKVSRGTLSVSSLNSVVGGTASSSLGHPTTVANGTISLGSSTTAGVLVYTGSGETSDRVISLAGTTGGATIQSDGTGPLTLMSSFTATGNGVKTLTLQGSNTGANQISGKIVDSTSATAVTKAQAGTWTLSGANTYTGNTSLSAGRLNIGNPAALSTGAFVISGNGSFDNTTGANLDITNAFTLSGGSPTYVGSANNMSINGPVAMTGGNRTITVSANTLTLGSGIDDAAQGRAFTKAGAGTLKLLGVNTYTGNTTISAGTLALGATASLASTNTVSISAGATLDVSAIANFVLGSSNLTATGTGTTGSTAATIVGGTTVDLGTKAITLTFKPTAFTGDSGHPALTISQGTLSLGGNNFSVNNASGTPLGAGTYQLIQQSTGNIVSVGTPTVTVTGSGLVPTATASIVVSGGNVNLVVTVPAGPATISAPTLLGDGTVQLNFTGTAGASYLIETTTNLNDPIIWTTLSTNTADGNGLFNFIDSDATNYVTRFYRAETQQ